MASQEELPMLTVSSQREWEEWLEVHHGEYRGVWLKLARKGSGIPSVAHSDAVESALCFGWIDGQGRSHDDSYWLQRFSPRTRRSRWSRINRERAIALIEGGRMRPAGMAQIEEAKRDGRWDAAYEPPSTATVPDDLQRELDLNPAAASFWASLNSQNRYAILHRIAEAKKPETRARRIDKFIGMLVKEEKLYP